LLVERRVFQLLGHCSVERQTPEVKSQRDVYGGFHRGREELGKEGGTFSVNHLPKKTNRSSWVLSGRKGGYGRCLLEFSTFSAKGCPFSVLRRGRGSPWSYLIHLNCGLKGVNFCDKSSTSWQKGGGNLRGKGGKENNLWILQLMLTPCQDKE